MLVNELLEREGIDPNNVLVLRHRPYEADFNRVFPRLVAERPDLFNAFQSSHGEKLEGAMLRLVGRGYLASFIAHGPARALYVGIFKIVGCTEITYEAFWNRPDVQELKSLGMKGIPETRKSIVWFDLAPTDVLADWSQKLIVKWPPPERSWWRQAKRNAIEVAAILEESALRTEVPHWTTMNFTWAELALLPARWRAKLSEWRAIYYIFDSAICKGYVGSAYGAENLLGRWLNYAASGHGGNRLLRQCDPSNFRFSIIERVSPDMLPEDVIALESNWKIRLHSRAPHGLNDN